MEIGLGQTRLVFESWAHGAMQIMMARISSRSITIARYGVLYMFDVDDLRHGFALRNLRRIYAFVNIFTFVLL